MADQSGQEIRDFLTANFDLVDFDDFRDEGDPTQAHYYHRPKKTILVRTVKDGGESYHISGDFDRSINGMQWAENGSGLYLTVSSEGTRNLHFASVSGGVKAISEGEHMFALRSFICELGRTLAWWASCCVASLWVGLMPCGM